MAFSLVTNAKGGGQDSAATSAVDTTGANFVWSSGSWYEPATNPTVSDNFGNTPSLLTVYPSTYTKSRIAYFPNPVVGAGHVVTWASTSAYITATMEAFSGANTSSPLDQETGGNASGTPPVNLSLGSLTPSEDDCLVVSSMAQTTGAFASTINGGFTITDQDPYATNIGGASAYLIQTTAAAANPTWSGGAGTGDVSGTLASFKAAGGGGGSPVRSLIAGKLLRGGMLLRGLR